MRKPLYLYSAWVRAWHWINAALFLALLVSGLSMHFAGTPWLLDFETARPVHNVSGYLLAAGWVVFVVGNLVTDNGQYYRIRFKGWIDRFMAQVRYYGMGIFKNEPHPFHPQEGDKLNELQKATYLSVMYGLMPLLIATGFAFLFAPYLPDTLLGIGSLWVIATAHMLMAYSMVLFLVGHVYIITVGDTVLTNFRAMITGWHGEPASKHRGASE